MFGGRYMKENIPVLLLKKLTILPSQEVRIELNNELSKKVIDLSTIEFSNKILIVLPSNTLEESPTITDLPKSGVLTLINSKIVLPNNNYRVVLKGLNRVKINNYQSYPNDKSILIGNAKMLYIDKGETLEETALKNSRRRLYLRRFRRRFHTGHCGKCTVRAESRSAGCTVMRCCESIIRSFIINMRQDRSTRRRLSLSRCGRARSVTVFP